MPANLFDQLSEAIQQQQMIGVATVIAGRHIGKKLLIWPDGRQAGDLGHTTLNAAASSHVAELFQSQQAMRLSVSDLLGIEGEETTDAEVFLEVHIPRKKLIIVGAVHIAIPLVTFGNALGFETIVLDARSAFATQERFAHASQLIVRWPADTLAEMQLDEATYIVFLTHDEKIDNPTLAVALSSKARYIGALGSRKTHAHRVKALRAEGMAQALLDRIHAPIGLAIGARRPEEIAVSIIGEIIQVTNQDNFSA